MRTFGISSFASLFGADVYSVHVSPLVVDGSKQCCDATIDFRHCLCWISFLPCVFYPCPILFSFIMIPSLPALFLLSPPALQPWIRTRDHILTMEMGEMAPPCDSCIMW